MSIRSLPAKPLTAEGFAGFGQVLSPPSRSERRYFGELLQSSRPNARLDLSFTTLTGTALPLRLSLFERHLHSSQAFIPLDVSRYLVTVCPDNGQGQPHVAAAVSFVAHGSQTVLYDTGTWHHPMVALDRTGQFAIAMWSAGDGEDEELVPLTEAIEVRQI
jgi:ureidoglycolate lyase